AARDGDPERYPVKTRKLKRTAQSLWLLHARAPDGSVWLQRRPSSGVWGGLYCTPVFGDRDELQQALPAECDPQDREPFVHVLTHKDLHLHPVVVDVARVPLPGDGEWFAQWDTLGLPSPIRKLLAG
ncbi:MAG TPA: NUDIX domain-containing protein, partial [Ramlibacter sp.]|nr:NUDIX domain-containing protein [Ramlibacter sp.]